jgi:ATP-dependent RNA circularization protein (DNA/RNA ligase family)
MTDFFKFPHTPHLAWLSPGEPRDDKVLTAAEREAFLAHSLVVEEKVDGANLGLSIGDDGEVRAQNRGAYIQRGTAGQFERLWPWLAPREEALFDALGPDLILFGEWCWARHSVEYQRLPDWFLAFDVWDKAAARFWCTERRDALVHSLQMQSVPQLSRGSFRLEDLKQLLGPSRLGSAKLEGVYLRVQDDRHLLNRAKLVRGEFVQAIGAHWSRGGLHKNTLLRHA